MSGWQSAYLFDTYSARPTYHAYGRIKDDMDVTVCGLVMYDGATRYAASMRSDHADKFAKPCRKCFPPVSAADGTTSE